MQSPPASGAATGDTTHRPPAPVHPAGFHVSSPPLNLTSVLRGLSSPRGGGAAPRTTSSNTRAPSAACADLAGRALVAASGRRTSLRADATVELLGRAPARPPASAESIPPVRAAASLCRPASQPQHLALSPVCKRAVSPPPRPHLGKHTPLAQPAGPSCGDPRGGGSVSPGAPSPRGGRRPSGPWAPSAFGCPLLGPPHEWSARGGPRPVSCPGLSPHRSTLSALLTVHDPVGSPEVAVATLRARRPHLRCLAPLGPRWGNTAFGDEACRTAPLRNTNAANGRNRR